MNELKVYISKEDEKQIRLYAEYTGRTISGLLRHCIKSEITRHRQPFMRWQSIHTGSGGESVPHVGKRL